MKIGIGLGTTLVTVFHKLKVPFVATFFSLKFNSKTNSQYIGQVM